MSNVLVDKQKIDLLANAISDKSGVPVTMTLDEMLSAVDGITLQSKSVSYIPSETSRSESITADNGYAGLSNVDVSIGAVSSSYVGSGIPRRTASDIEVYDNEFKAPPGYYATDTWGEVPYIAHATPSVSVNSSGLITASHTQNAGYIMRNSTTTATQQLTTQAAQTIYPSTSNQTINSGRYLTGNQTINAISQTNLLAANIKSGTTITISNGQSNLWSVLGTYTGSGSGGPTLLNTTSIGSVNTTSTQAASLNINCVVSGVNDYDLLIVEASVNSLTASRHAATVSLIFLTAGSAIDTKNGATIATAKLNIRVGTTTSTLTSNASTTAYGIYANSCSISSGTATIAMYRRYNSTSSGTINGNYTARVYGVNLADLIGG